MIRFDELAVGQRSRYAVLIGERYGDPAGSPFRYVDGRLLVEVVAKDELGFRFRESFEVPVDVTQAWELESLDPDAVYEYHVRVVDGALEVLLPADRPGSRLFPSGTPHLLPLANIEEQETQVFGWVSALPYCECYREAFIKNGELHGATYDRLNVVVDDEAMQYDGPGMTKLFSARHGVVRSSFYYFWTQTGVGLDLIPGE